MNRLRVLIVDDEALARQRLRGFVEEDPELEIIGECTDGRTAREQILDLAPELVFLDIHIPEIDGFGVLAGLNQDELPAVIFTTAYDKYAIRAFEIHALDYLLKPFGRLRFASALGHAKQKILNNPVSPVDSLPQVVAESSDLPGVRRPHLDRLVVKAKGRMFVLRAEEIDWIEGDGNYIKLHAGARSFMLRETMNGIAAKLDPAKFLRIHRSTIVNIDCIESLEPSFRGDHLVILRGGGSQLTLSRKYRDQFESAVGWTL